MTSVLGRSLACRTKFLSAKRRLLRRYVANETTTSKRVSFPVGTTLRQPCDIQPKIAEIIKYLRETAQTCVSLARACPRRASALGLEEVAADMMAKAEELEELKLE